MTERDTPVQVHGPMNIGFLSATAILGLEVANSAVDADQNVWSWGGNPVDDLGDGVSGGSSLVPAPVLVSTGPDVQLGSIVSLGGRGDNGLAIDVNASVWAWGANFDGQLGNNTDVNSPLAVQVLAGAGPGTGPGGVGGFLAEVVQVTGGGQHSIALDSSSHVWGWGDNFHGQVGDGSFTRVAPTYVATPVQVMVDLVHPLTNVVQVSGGWNYTMALRSDGTVWVWGTDTEGELGNGARGNETNDSNVAIQVMLSDDTPLTNVVAVSGGDFHAAALKSDGTVWAWGQNIDCQLGNGNCNDNAITNLWPAQVIGPNGVGLLTDAILLSVREAANLVVQLDGSVWTWGAGGRGNLGTGGVANSPFPVPVSGLGPTP